VAELKALVANPEDRVSQVVRPGPAMGLLDGYMASLASLKEPPSAELGTVIGVHLLDLVAAALGPTAEGQEIIAGRGLKAARLRVVLAEIARRFGNPDLDVDAIASGVGLSRRSVQRLLEETGKPFTEQVTERRLQRAYVMLSDPAFLHLRIIDIALAAGFGDVSHFNRLFRRRVAKPTPGEG
jgi:AraC-like DNA-binding protein